MENKQHYIQKVIPFLLLIIVAVTVWFQMEASCNYKNLMTCFQMKGKYIFLNIFTHFAFIILIYVFLNKIWLSTMLYSIVGVIVSLVNYYVVTLKGMPLTILEIKNFKTAMNVIGSYKLEITGRVICIFSIFILNIVLCVLIKKFERTQKLKLRSLIARNLIVISLSVIVMYACYFAPNSIKPKKVVSWLWSDAYSQYGYVACAIEMVGQMINAVEMPDGYSEDKVNEIVISDIPGVNATPDIILILNETLYDLSLITDLQADVPIFEKISAMDNVIKGNAIVPLVGGGTNNSEYELLTSNSLQIMKGITPFNALDLRNANSVVTHLEKLGYQTTGAHHGAPESYSRGRAYVDIGFDNIYFSDDFVNKEAYGKRSGYSTDASLYEDFIIWYENQIVSDAPQFMYLLTIQNHGGWDINPPELDIVHAETNYGDYDAAVDEYLSCIKLSDEAFYDLTDYFSSLNRDVLVCMVGDHAPSFADKIIDTSDETIDSGVALRSTPFIIWANFDIEDKEIPYISLNQLVPTMLEAAGVKLSPYYQYILDLQKKVPVIPTSDFYIDSTGEKWWLGSGVAPYKEEIRNYYYLEYNNMQNSRIQNLFEP